MLSIFMWFSMLSIFNGDGDGDSGAANIGVVGFVAFGGGNIGAVVGGGDICCNVDGVIVVCGSGAMVGSNVEGDGDGSNRRVVAMIGFGSAELIDEAASVIFCAFCSNVAGGVFFVTVVVIVGGGDEDNGGVSGVTTGDGGGDGDGGDNRRFVLSMADICEGSSSLVTTGAVTAVLVVTVEAGGSSDGIILGSRSDDGESDLNASIVLIVLFWEGSSSLVTTGVAADSITVGAVEGAGG